MPRERTRWDPKRRLNVYLADATEVERFNAAAARAGMAHDRGGFLMKLLDLDDLRREYMEPHSKQ